MNPLVKTVPGFLFLVIALGCGSESTQSTPSNESAATVKSLDEGMAPANSSPAASPNDSGPAVSIAPPTPAAVLKAKQEKSEALPEIEASTLAAVKPEIELKTVTIAEFKEFVASQKGKVLAVDCWATWCLHCVANMPKFVKMTERHKTDKAHFASLSFNNEEEIAEAVEFLGKLAVPFTCLRITDKENTTFEEAFGFEGLPRYLVFDTEGKLVASSDKFEIAEAKVEELLK